MAALKIGVVGLNFGKSRAVKIQGGETNGLFQLAAVCDLDAGKVDESAAEFGVKGFTDLEKLLAEDDIPVIGLFTGPAGRAELIRKIIRSGKHVITTKPFELDPDAALSVLQEAKRLGKVVHMNSPAPILTPELRQIKEWTTLKSLGRPIACRCEVWTNTRESVRGGWYDDPSLCPAAPVFRLGIYLINNLVRLFGKPKAVQVMDSRIFTERPTADNAQLSIYFENGALANIFASFCIGDGQFHRYGMVINYENGTVYRNSYPYDNDKPEHTTLTLVTRAPDRNDVPIVERIFCKGGIGSYQWMALHQAIQGVVLEDEISPEEIVESVKIISAMKAAKESGCTELV